MRGNAQPPKRLPPVSIRLSADERAQLERQAGNQPLTSYMKAVLLRGEAPRKREGRTQTDYAMLARVLAILGQSQIAASLESLARAASDNTLFVDDQTVRQMREAFNAIASMHYCLLTALGKRPDRAITLPVDLSAVFADAAQNGEVRP